jgi:uncharacterized protein YutE (UPF0331/DUF86 family)
MVGFRNAVVHHYQRMDIQIVKLVIASGLVDLVVFGDRIMTYLEEPPDQSPVREG